LSAPPTATRSAFGLKAAQFKRAPGPGRVATASPLCASQRFHS
jgi:hypothetical protein